MQLLQLLKSKIHHAHVTYCNQDYVGSIEIDGALMDAVGMQNGELVHVWAVDQPARIITYAFRAEERGSVGLNGGAAQFFRPGDRVVIASFALSDEPVEPKVIALNGENEILNPMVPFTKTGV
jgi:aspartate 1-decarboxylase